MQIMHIFWCYKGQIYNKFGATSASKIKKQGRKRPLYTPKRMIERRERERKVEGEI